MGASVVYFRDASFFLWFVLSSLPLSFLATLRLHAGNMKRIPFDAMAGTNTIARELGFRWSKLAHAFLLFAPFLTICFLTLFQITGKSSLICFLSLPFAVLSLKSLLTANGPLDPACVEMRMHAARLHFVFGFLYCISFLIP
jgi:1,4-dihydroxy-2-naphthoate octaprenyltransferase